MAKRFRDTRKWRGWFRELPVVYKLLFDYMCDDCDHAGFFKEDYVLASLCIGADVSRKDVESDWLKDKVIRVDKDKLFIPSFIEFQYQIGTCALTDKLNPKNNAHIGVIRELRKNGIDPSPWTEGKPLPSPSPAPHRGAHRGAQDKEQEKDKDKEKEQEEEDWTENPQLVQSIIDNALSYSTGRPS